ncbi:hypothetical protein A2V49_04235 [candidate division WWE3 bacterium RBG_19FT_COMBO_34_6]|uniref:Uncharacterized protein n=1 Tax=candidate division WWE3 bacterium RBG_19FT_COMBO_34_6 TaxID=1802612 RepID=A0A1F4UKP6_UNCKA|nr:MAG: hypothetical protein A2V49_04235 [candidate division WWE3 bacterium RBG_19FT_COMBO_34_6]
MDGKYIKAMFKIFLMMILVALLVQAVSFGIYWYNLKNYSKRGNIAKEKERCDKVVNEQTGELTDFSYCKRYLEWYRQNVKN